MSAGLPHNLRLPEWEANLNAVLALHRDLPGAWGRSDCWMLTCAAHEAVTGRVLLPQLARYTSEAGGYRLFNKHGFASVQRALESILAPVPVLMARRGDIACISHGGGISCGPVTAVGVAIKSIHPDGRSALAYHPVTAAVAAFTVG